MRITIDTQHDSKEDILKAIKLLYSITNNNEETFSNDIKSEETTEISSEASPGFVNMFGAEPVSSMVERPKDEDENEVKKEDDAQIIFEY